ncbi:MAG: transcription factor, partial [Pseudomonadota bacterium]
VRWELDPQGDFRTQLDGPGGVRAFSCTFVVRGFDLDEGLPLDLSRAVDATELQTDHLPPSSNAPEAKSP